MDRTAERGSARRLRSPRRVHIAICHRLTEPDSGLDAGELRWLLARQASLEIVEDACNRPAHVAACAAGARAEALIIGACADHGPADEFGAWARKEGLDPLAVELLPLAFTARARPRERATTDAAALLAGAVAVAHTRKLPRDSGRRPAVVEGRLGRRTLLAAGLLTDRAVAAIDAEICVAAMRRCSLCVEACPAGAIDGTTGRPSVNISVCDGCGACVTACHVEAILVSGSSLSEYEARFEAMLRTGAGRSVILACRDADPRIQDADGDPAAKSTAGWLPVELPCLRMATPGWVLSLLAGGAGGVALLPCEAARTAGWGLDGLRSGFCASALEASGETQARRRIRILPQEPAEFLEALDPPLVGRFRSWKISLREPAATTEALLALAARGGLPPAFAHEGSPAGLLSMNVDACTLCGACSPACPTGALIIRETEDDGWTLHLNATRCVACHRCETVCPEHVITVRGGIDRRAYPGGEPVLLAEGPSARCSRCGRALVPAGVLGRVAEVLGGAPNLCGDCALLAPAG